MPTKAWMDERVHLQAWITREENIKLNDVVSRRDYSLSGWIREKINEDEGRVSPSRKVNITLSEDEAKRLKKVLDGYGYDAQQWFRACLDREDASRNPEGQGKVVRIEHDREQLELISEAVIWYAAFHRTNADWHGAKDEDPSSRKRFRSLAEKIDDIAYGLLQKIDEMNKAKHLIATGKRKARHRYKDDQKSA